MTLTYENFITIISKCHTSWREGFFVICDMSLVAISLIVGTKNFVGSCEVLGKVCKNEKVI